MHRSVILAVLISSQVAVAQTTPSIQELIQQLDSKDFRDREKAMKLIRERGPEVLPDLEKAVPHPSKEAQRRLTVLIRDLKIARALQPKLITIKKEPLPLKGILEKLEKQTGYTFEADKVLQNEVVNIEMKDVPFWRAMDRISRSVKDGLVTGQ